jgi:protease-4
MTANDRPSRRRRLNKKAAWVTGGLLFLVAFGLMGVITGGPSVPGSKPHLARITLQGPILSAEPTVDLLRKARERSGVRGVLLRINSPGGGVGASEALYEAVNRLSAEKPVAVSMGAMAASGGYMTALGGDRIFALDSTLTGSIGVIMVSSGIYPLLDKIGVEPRIIKSGEFKDAGTPLREMSEADRAYLQSTVDELHDQFAGLVAERRGLSRKQVDKLADGRIFSGRQAVKNGLVDARGGLPEAKSWLRKEAGLPEGAPVQELKPPREWLGELMPAGWAAWISLRLSPKPQYLYLAD